MPTTSNLLCGCGRFMRPKRNSVTVEELLEDGSPYKLWDADLWECVECGVEVIAGFGRGPLAEHWQPDYADQRNRLGPVYPGRCRAAEMFMPLPPDPIVELRGEVATLRLALIALVNWIADKSATSPITAREAKRLIDIVEGRDS